MLGKIYYLYKTSPKRLCELKEFASIFEKTVKGIKTNRDMLDCTQSQWKGQWK